MENFADNLKELIEEKQLSLRKLGKEIGVTSGQLSRWLNGKCPTIDNAIKLAKYFDCSLDYLFGIYDGKNYSNYVNVNYDFNLFIEIYKQMLIENKLSHAQFTRQSNINESCLRDWKKGHKPLMDTLVIISKNFSCSIDYLLGRIDKNEIKKKCENVFTLF